MIYISRDTGGAGLVLSQPEDTWAAARSRTAAPIPVGTPIVIVAAYDLKNLGRKGVLTRDLHARQIKEPWRQAMFSHFTESEYVYGIRLEGDSEDTVCQPFQIERTTPSGGEKQT
jgi:hypothetical protein